MSNLGHSLSDIKCTAILLMIRYRKGRMALNHGYNTTYTPVLRNPRLFHQNTVRVNPTYYPIQQTSTRPASHLYPPLPSHHTLYSQSMVQSQLLYRPQYPNYSNSPRSAVLSPIPFSSYSVPTYSYTPTVSSKGLSLILISTLILVALDLIIVRPQKR